MDDREVQPESRYRSITLQLTPSDVQTLNNALARPHLCMVRDATTRTTYGLLCVHYSNSPEKGGGQENFE